MCSKISCPSCSMPTWKGCGEHIEAALHDVAPNDRCSCPRGSQSAARQVQTPFGGTSAGSW